MPISENDRLDLRQALADVLGSERLAEVAMEAMPPLDYDQLATTADLDILGRELRAEMSELRAELRGEMSGLRGELKSDLASNLRLMLAAQVTTMMMLGAWVTAVT
jgi:DnaJ-domain-containing protein 1